VESGELNQSLPRAGNLLLEAIKAGTTLDKVRALEVAGVANQPVLLTLLRASFVARSRWLREVAFRQAARLVQMPVDIAEAIRIVLIHYARAGTLAKEKLTIGAQLRLLDRAATFQAAVKLLLAVYPVDLALAAVYGLILMRIQHLHGYVSGFSLIVVFVLTGALNNYFTLLTFARQHSRQLAGEIREPKHSDFPSWFLAAVYFRALTFIFLSSFVSVGLPGTSHLELHARWLGNNFKLVAMSVYFALWTPCALFAIQTGKHIAVAWWPALPFTILAKITDFKMYRKLWGTLKSKWKTWVAVLAGYALLQWLVIVMVSHVATIFARLQVRFPFLRNFGAAMIPIALIPTALLLIIRGVKILRDYYAWGKRDSQRFETGEGFASSLAIFRTERFRSRFLASAQQKGEVVPARETEQCLTELALVIEKELSLSPDDRKIFAHGRVQANASNTASRSLLNWYIEQTADCQRKLGWGDETVDGLYRLVEQLKVSLEESVGVGIGR